MGLIVSRGKIWPLVLLATICAICLAAFYLWRDLNLPVTAVLERLPDVVVENLNFRREVGGREWQVVAVTAEHEGDAVKASSIDLLIRDEAANRRTGLRAVSGDFSQETSDVTLHSIDGVLFHADGSVDMTAPFARYDSGTDTWIFPQGIEMRDGETRLTGETATVTPEGVFTVERGATLLWDID